jgi:integrase
MASEIMQIAMDLASNIGQRREDLLSLRWDEVNEISGTPVEQGKTGASLLIEMSPGFQSALARAWAMKPDNPKVYVLRTRKGTRYTGDGFSTIWQRLMKKALAAEVLDRPFAWKDLRAKAAQDKTDLEGIEAAQQLLGHTTPATTKKHYVTRLPPTRVKPVR